MDPSLSSNIGRSMTDEGAPTGRTIDTEHRFAELLTRAVTQPVPLWLRAGPRGIKAVGRAFPLPRTYVRIWPDPRCCGSDLIRGSAPAAATKSSTGKAFRDVASHRAGGDVSKQCLLRT